MMVRRMLANVSSKLGYLNLRLELLLEAGKQNLALTWLESIKHVRDGPDVVVLREEYKFTIDKVGVVTSFVLRISHIQECVFLHTGQPPLSILNLTFTKCHFDETRSGLDEFIGLVVVVLLLLLFAHVIIIIFETTATDMIGTDFIEVYLMYIKVREVVFGLGTGRCPKTLVILDSPSFGIILSGLLPSLVLWLSLYSP